ncbi:hypothetical protein HYH02_000779 [Chlamydomonas schloesseri]|uniref:Fungal lipase-like domain-containing protein n=1 Tax=Chlamydomonas schloesseri TaxID=2026947 RepID=A0A835WWY8_9CHLO|nr:hypothetical protein HYH02_000779 [Chlamydomonas schloesseri]|eukprot:KAG2454952.1 hypothetical protein HYH02_000779 [Chlamydomonas schloesseri]
MVCSSGHDARHRETHRKPATVPPPRHTKGLPGPHRDELLRLLAAAAANVCQHDGKGHKYDENKYLGGRLRRTEWGSRFTAGAKDFMAYGVYAVVSGPLHGKIILAYQGSSCDAHLVQDFKQLLGGRFKFVADKAQVIFEDVCPDFITGHSLGGCIAEVICSRTGCPGAAFNSPGPWSPDPDHCVVDGEKHGGVNFEIHLAVADPLVSLANTSAGRMPHSHIGSEASGAVRWHYNISGLHSMDAMVNVLGRL